MYCPSCGKEIVNEAVVCVGCGRPVKPLSSGSEKWGPGVMTALVIGTLLVPLIGIIFGIIGLNKEAKKSQGGILLGLGIFMGLVSLMIIA
jgi:hypothetical protein